MQLALIPPLSRLDDLKLTNYQLALPHLLLLRDKGNYSCAYREAADRGDYVILDNGAADSGLWNWHELLALAENINATEVVLPDVIGYPKKTWALVEKVWKDRDTNRKYMYVVHGRDVQVLIADALVALDLGVHTIGIPRHLVTTLRFDARIRVAEALLQARPRDEQRYGYGPYTYDIHFLGTNPHWTQEVRFAEELLPGEIRGVDTSAPYVYAWKGLTLASDEEVKRPEWYFDRRYPSYNSAAYEEIARLKRWCGYKETS